MSTFVLGYSRKLKLYPNGLDQAKGNSVSLFLELAGTRDLPPKRKVYAEYKLRVPDQLNDNHQERKVPTVH